MMPQKDAGKCIPSVTFKRESATPHQPSVQTVNRDQANSTQPAEIQARFLQAVSQHQRGQLEEADALYQQLLALAPDHFDALHLRGVLLHQQRRNDIALGLIQKAIELNPGEAAAHSNVGLVLQALGRPEDAVASYDRAVALKPDSAEPLVNRGNALLILRRATEALESYDRALALRPTDAGALNGRGIALSSLNRYEEALASLDRALAVRPEYPEALLNRGVALSRLMRHEEALASYDRALTLRAEYAEALSNRGSALASLNRDEDALASLDAALALKPDYIEALANRGGALYGLKRPREALASLDRVLKLEPDHIEALLNRGNALRDLGRYEDALASFNRVLGLDPGVVEALVSRGAVLGVMRRTDEALASHEHALGLRPDHPGALIGRGNALAELKRPEEAVASYDEALAQRPDFSEALLNRSAVLRELKRPEEAARSYARLLEIDPQYPYAEGYAFHSRLHACDWTSYAASAKRIEDAVGRGRRVDAPFSFLVLSDSIVAQRRCAQTWVEDNCPAASEPIWTGARYGNDRIRIAYLSADFQTHATAHLMAELFETHDRSRFEVFGVSFGPADPGGMRARLRRAFDRFIDASGSSDRQVAQMLAGLKIDIAIDLKGFTQGARPAIFAHRAAPVQVNYLGYPGTMGAQYIDYVIADRHVIPREQEPFYAEKVVRLPDTYQPNDRTRAIASRTPSREEAGLPPTGFVFCCFNNSFKIAPAVFDIWMRVLARVEGSVLWLLEDNATASRNLRREAQLRGISAERIVFAGRMNLADHLARHRSADLFVDTLPYNAHTTASDALWAGLPVLTCRGSTFVGRVAASLLHAVGLPELVTHSLAEYEALAFRLSTTPGMLDALRTRLARNRTTHPLFDTDRFRQHMEKAYVRMHQQSQEGGPPVGFDVQPIA